MLRKIAIIGLTLALGALWLTQREAVGVFKEVEVRNIEVTPGFGEFKIRFHIDLDQDPPRTDPWAVSYRFAYTTSVPAIAALDTLVVEDPPTSWIDTHRGNLADPWFTTAWVNIPEQAPTTTSSGLYVVEGARLAAVPGVRTYVMIQGKATATGHMGRWHRAGYFVAYTLNNPAVVAPSLNLSRLPEKVSFDTTKIAGLIYRFFNPTRVQRRVVWDDAGQFQKSFKLVSKFGAKSDSLWYKVVSRAAGPTEPEEAPEDTGTVPPTEPAPEDTTPPPPPPPPGDRSFWIAVNGSDGSGDGSFNNPWKTPTAAVGKIPEAGGDTIWMKPGIYRAAAGVNPAGQHSFGIKPFRNPVVLKSWRPYEAEIVGRTAGVRIGEGPGSVKNLWFEDIWFRSETAAEASGHGSNTKQMFMSITNKSGVVDTTARIKFINCIIGQNYSDDLVQISAAPCQRGETKQIHFKQCMFYNNSSEELIDLNSVEGSIIEECVFWWDYRGRGGKSNEGVVFKNSMSNSGWGDGQAGIWCQGNYTYLVRSKDNILRKNLFIHRNLGASGGNNYGWIGFSQGGASESDRLRPAAENFIVENNIFVGDSPTSTVQNAQAVWLGGQSTKNTTVRFNTIVTRRFSHDNPAMYHFWSEGASAPTNKNLAFAGNAIAYYGNLSWIKPGPSPGMAYMTGEKAYQTHNLARSVGGTLSGLSHANLPNLNPITGDPKLPHLDVARSVPPWPQRRNANGTHPFRFEGVDNQGNRIWYYTIDQVRRDLGIRYAYPGTGSSLLNAAPDTTGRIGTIHPAITEDFLGTPRTGSHTVGAIERQ